MVMGFECSACRQPACSRTGTGPAQSHRARGFVQFLTSVVAYLALAVLTHESISVSPLLALALALAPLAGGFLVRTFIVFHDCTHGSFWPSKRGNEWVDRLCGLLTLSAFASWRHDHAIHHATAGDLDRRRTGDIPTLAVADYTRDHQSVSAHTRAAQPFRDVRNRAGARDDDQTARLEICAATASASQRDAHRSLAPCGGGHPDGPPRPNRCFGHWLPAGARHAALIAYGPSRQNRQTHGVAPASRDEGTTWLR
ncbi:MAG: fatty acid desaturase [Solirubrobacteraceae bacterium]